MLCSRSELLSLCAELRLSDATVEALFRGTANRPKISRGEFLRLFPGRKGENLPGNIQNLPGKRVGGGEKWQNSGRSRSVDEEDSAEEEDDDERRRERWRWRRPRRKGE